jgi:hypothetical protein
MISTSKRAMKTGLSQLMWNMKAPFRNRRPCARMSCWKSRRRIRNSRTASLRVPETYDRTKNEKDRKTVERYRAEWARRFESGLNTDSEEFRLFMKASDAFEELLGKLYPQPRDV